MRNSKDRKLNGEGRKLVDFIEERGRSVFNENIKRDKEGEFTFTGGKGNTMINCVIGDVEAREGMLELRVGDKTDSDYHPVVVTVRGEDIEREVRGEGKKKERGNLE